MKNEIPTHILNHLLNNEDFCRRVVPYLKKEYFEGEHTIVFDLITDFVRDHNKLPTSRVLEIEIKKVSAPDETLTRAYDLIQEISVKSDIDTDYLIAESEKWCRDKAIYGAIMNSIQIIDGKNEEQTEGAIPEILQEALGVSFDQAIGHDYINDADSRFDFYNNEEEKIPFDLDLFNKMTKGGLPNKTLNIALAGTGVGKSLFMCHMGANAISEGKNVLYITMEMAEERIAERIDANLMDIPIQQLSELPKNVFDEKIKKIFTPDMIFIDYLNICSSARVKNTSANSYTIIKSIAEELRGLAVEFDLPIMSATQTTRSGFGNTDVGLEDTSESFGLPATADLMFALISTEELEGLNQIMVKQLKNRYNDPTKYKRFVVGIDRAKMKLYDVEESAQDNIMQDMAIPDKPINSFGNNEKSDFSGFTI